MKLRDYLSLSVFLILIFVYSKGIYIFFSVIFLTLSTLIVIYDFLTKREIRKNPIKSKFKNKHGHILKYVNLLVHTGMICLLLYSIQDALPEKVISLILLSASIGAFLFLLTLFAEKLKL